MASEDAKKRKKVMVTIKNYNSEESDDGDFEEVIMRKPSERRSKPTMEALRDQTRLFVGHQSTYKETPSQPGPSAKANDNSPSSSTVEAPTVQPTPEPKFPPSTVELPDVASTISSSDSSISSSLSSTSTSLSSSSSEDPEESVPLSKLIQSGKVKKTKKKKKKDPNEPQKPVSAYALFFRDTQSGIKVEKPDASFGEISKIVATLWDHLDVEKKSDYKKRTEMAKKEYLRKLAAYKAKLISSEMPTEPLYTNDGAYLPPSAQQQQQLYDSSPEQPTRYTIPTDPNHRGTIRCISEGCNNISIEDPRWDRQYCSTECVVRHCRDAFQNWVIMQQEPSFHDISMDTHPPNMQMSA